MFIRNTCNTIWWMRYKEPPLKYIFNNIQIIGRIEVYIKYGLNNKLHNNASNLDFFCSV